MNSENKQVTLIIPQDQNVETPHLFIGVLYLASYLDQHGIKVKIYDEQKGEASQNLGEIIQNSFLVGFTVMTSQLKSASELSKKIKQAGLPIVWGGMHPTLFLEQCLHEDYVDYAAYDEGEKTLLELVAHLLDQNNQKDQNDLSTIKGLGYKKSGQIFKNPSQPYLDLNEISPNWKLMDPQKYIEPRLTGGKMRNILLIHTGRGCPYSCTFCVNTLLNQRKWRGITAENIIHELKNLAQYAPLECIDFVDENSLLDLPRLEKFCDIYQREGFKFTWIINGRVNYFHPRYLSDELLQKMSACGCVEVRMGLESGSQYVLDKIINKGIRKEEILPALKRIINAGMGISCSFMIGLPHERNQDRLETIDLILEILKLSKTKTHIMGPQLYRPYPGAKMYLMAKKLGFQEPENIEGWVQFMNQSGFLDVRKLSWIEDKQKLETTYKSITYSQISPQGLAKVPGLFFRELFRLRMKTKFFYLPIDLKMYEFFKDFYLESVISNKKNPGQN